MTTWKGFPLGDLPLILGSATGGIEGKPGYGLQVDLAKLPYSRDLPIPLRNRLPLTIIRTFFFFGSIPTSFVNSTVGWAQVHQTLR